MSADGSDPRYRDGRRPFTTKEVRRLLDALAEGKLGPPDDVDNVALQKKLTVVLQVATATEKRRRSSGTK